jgi:hypothetical protein
MGNQEKKPGLVCIHDLAILWTYAAKRQGERAYDTPNQVLVRVLEQFDAGMRLVWVVDPQSEAIAVFRPRQQPYVLTKEKELTGDDVLPDFRCKVAEFFRTPGQ